MKTKFFTIILAAVASIGTMYSEVYTGTCGNNLNWELNTIDSSLVITGSGAMYDFTGGYDSPWGSYFMQIANVSLPNGLTSIGDYAFFSFENLRSINIPDSVTYIGKESFHGCYKLPTIHIPAGVTRIYQHTFEECHSLLSVNLPNGVTQIDQYAFEECWSLQSVIVPNSVTSISQYAFSGCKSITSFEIPDGITIIDYGILSGCSSLTSVIIPNSVTKIKEGAFTACTSLTSISIPNSVTSIGQGTFCNSGLISISLPEGLTGLTTMLFDGCSNLQSITIPNNVASVGDYAFRNCTSLTAIELPESVNYIRVGAFKGCTGLTSVVLPKNVKSIDKYAFSDCSNIQLFSIPATVTKIGSSAFENCISLAVLYCYATTPPSVYTSTFTNANVSSCTLYVPSTSIELYNSANTWKEFRIMAIPSETHTIQFVDWNGTVLFSEEVEDGAAATAPTSPVREGYTFIGWDKDFSNITEDLIVSAVYKINRYEVKFVDWDDAIIKSDSVDWNTAAVAPEDPIRIGYTFVGWNKDFSNVTENLIITALYEVGEKIYFTINFNINGNEVVSNSIVLKVPSAPQIEGFTFIGWRPVSAIIEGNVIEVEAVYETDELSSTPLEVNVPGNKARKLIRQGNVYILRGDKIYTLTGQEVK